MSHFTVMVIGDDAEKQLAPYHEYECTGVDDEYVIDVDCTDEVQEWKDKIIYAGITKKDGEPDYEFHEAAAIKNLNGWTTMSRAEWLKSKGEDLATEISDWFGYQLNDEGQYIRHTNPNSKWDWYQVGGRWSGFFKMKDTINSGGQLGERSWTNKDKEIDLNYADVTTKGNIDIVGMQDGIRKRSETEFDNLVAAMGDTTPVSWSATREEYLENGKTIEQARVVFHDTEFKKSISAWQEENGTEIGSFFGDIYDEFYLRLPMNQARVRYVETAVMNVVTPFAFVKDSQWVEKGEMGWFGMSSNEMEKDDWTQKFYDMFMALPDDTILTMVDCHI